MSQSELLLRIYRFAYRYHLFFRALTQYAFVGATIFLVLAFFNDTPVMQALSPIISLIAIILAVFWLLGLLGWILLSGWHSVTFRYVILWASLTLGKLRHWLFTGWRSGVLLFLVAVLLAFLYSQFLGLSYTLKDFFTPELLVEVLVVVALLLIARWALRARRRIVILAFTNYTGDETMDACVDGSAAQLYERLVSIAELYRAVEELSPFEPGTAATKGGPAAVNATISTADIGQAVQSIATADSKLSFGPLTIPIGAVLGLLGKVVEGPRLTGSLHRVGDRLMLTATLNGGSLQGNWRVSESDLQDELFTMYADVKQPEMGGGTQAIGAMLEMMAYRVFAAIEQSQLGSTRWQAVYHFTQGLRYYRRSLRTFHGTRLNLRRAEQAFIRALAEDRQFVHCLHNLGIVYNQLSQPESAYQSFLKAVQVDPGFVEAYYALANSTLSQLLPRETLRYCEQLLRMVPQDARVWNMMGLAHNQLRAPQERVIQVYAIAAARAWRGLCGTALSGRINEKQRSIVTPCLHNVASARERVAELRQAIYLEPTNARLHWALGAALLARRNFVNAAEAFGRMVQIAEWPGQWAWLALALANLQGITRLKFWLRLAHVVRHPSDLSALRSRTVADSEIDEAVKMALDRGGSSDLEDALAIWPGWNQDPQRDHSALEWYRRPFRRQIRLYDETMLAALQPLRYGARCAQHVRLLRTWLEHVTTRSIDGKITLERRQEKLEQRAALYEQINFPWAAAQVDIQLAYAQAGYDDRSAIQLWQRAIEGLRFDHAQEVRERGLYSEIAKAHLSQNQLQPALDAAQMAVQLNPNRSNERAVLGEVYLALQDFERAQSELFIGLQLASGSLELVIQGVSKFVQKTLARPTRELRRRGLPEIMGALQLLIDSLQYDDDNATWIGAAYFWQACIASELLQHDLAMACIQTALNTTYKPLEARVSACWIFLEAKAYPGVEDHWCMVVKEISAQRHKTKFWDLPASGVQEQIPLCSLLVMAYLYSALALAERGVKLNEALRRTRRARRHIQLLRREERDQLEAFHEQTVGWIRFRQFQLRKILNASEAEANLCLEQATQSLERAVSLVANSDAYYHLAKVYAAQADRAATSADREQWQARTREAYQHAQQADLRGEYAEEMASLLKPAVEPDQPAPRVIELHVKDA